jgi:hypothetical protein
MRKVAEGFMQDLLALPTGPPQQVGLIALAAIAASDDNYMNRTFSGGMP